MLSSLKYSKLAKIAVCLFTMTLAVFLLVNFALAAGADLGLNYAEGTGLSNAVDIRIIIARIIRVALGFLGIIAVGLIIYAGFLWMTSGGNEEKIEQAKAILKNAVIGLIIVLSAFAIASFVLNMLLNASGGRGNNQPGAGPVSGGITALGNGIIESHYPARGQKDVPRNTSIIVTFREAMKLETLCSPVDDGDLASPKCNGGDAQNVRIFKLLDQNQTACLAGTTGCTSLVAAKAYSTPNKKIFVFVPKSYLGSPSEYIDYAVYLTKDIKKANGDNAFSSLENGYEWSFQVSNKIDLTPPQVKAGGIFPAPDVAQDQTNPTAQARQAQGKIQVNSQPSVRQAAKVASTNKFDPQSTTPPASTAINIDCQQDGVLKVDVIDNGGLVARLFSPAPAGMLLGQGTFGQNGDGNRTITFSECDLVLTLDRVADNFSAGDAWSITVAKAIGADTLTVGSAVYTFVDGTASERQISVGSAKSETASNISETASNIRDVLKANSELDAAKVTWDGNVLVTLKAKVAGVAGNNIELSTSNPSALAITPLAGGTDKQETIIVKGRRDKPMNATIQIDFNEAIMPLTVSGMAAEVVNYIRVVNADSAAKPRDEACSIDADCQSFQCESGKCAGDNNYLKGKFAVSNQYVTVNFISDKECGFNSCGERIYCLPANSHLKVELNAASLAACDPAKDNPPDCASRAPFTNCVGGACQNADGHKYPQADLTKANMVDGIVDVAMNSLDGNRDGFAQGPASYYDETYPDATKGDNFQWSFFISDQMDITSPKITETTPLSKAENVTLQGPVFMHFDKLMMSARLNTGSIEVINGQQTVTHRLINLESMAQAPLAYWVTSQGTEKGTPDGEYEETDVNINHSDFSNSTSYRAQAGSGLEDVYQNCYMPCSGPGCDATTEAPSCCNSEPEPVESCP
jgi:hypothetical protein